MRQSRRLPPSGVQLLPPGTGSLARGLPPCPRGTLFAPGERGGISVAPTARFTVVFGRNEPEVHVCVGEQDRRVSRQQGTAVRRRQAVDDPQRRDRAHPVPRWTAKQAEHIVGTVRNRLARQDVRGLIRIEVGEPVGNALNHNLVVELLLSTTLVPPDLRLLD